ncbi:hypothetical protein B9Z65_8469 [Elsinoe australis]|uniref:BTB domain-containing protein n=1 Tax=Elsinoe australis TaxID=40998 RepID=A0A2P7YDV0_9PEZI|nr:hypothetical protein B9Z65_8469 [Elsinoe australis]
MNQQRSEIDLTGDEKTGGDACECNNEGDDSNDSDARKCFEETVNVIVGKKKKVFRIHKAILTAASPFFRAALSGSWLKSSTMTIELADDRPFIFALFADWAYSGNVYSFWWMEDQPVPKLSTLVRLYIMGEQLQAEKLKIEVIKAIHGRYPDLSHVRSGSSDSFRRSTRKLTTAESDSGYLD